MQTVIGRSAGKRRERGAREPRRDDAGFTLIELLVVVVIIGILVAIAIPLYLNYRRGAENKSAQSDLRNAVAAVEACSSDNGNKAPLIAGGGSSYYAPVGSTIYFTCKPDGSGVISTTAPAAGTPGTQQVNLSPGVALSFYAYSGSSYSLSTRYDNSPDDHRIFSFVSATGKFATYN